MCSVLLIVTVSRFCLECVPQQCDRPVGCSQDVFHENRQQLVPATGHQQPYPGMHFQHPEDQPKQWVLTVSSTHTHTHTHTHCRFTEVGSLLCSWSDQKSPLPTGNKTRILRASGQAVSNDLGLKVPRVISQIISM